MAKKAFKAVIGGALGDMLNMAQSACEMPSEAAKTAKNEQKPKEKPIRASIRICMPDCSRPAFRISTTDR